MGAAALVAVLLALPAPQAGVAAVSVSDLPTDTTGAAPAVALRRDGDVVRLTLEEAVLIALQRNLGLAVERYNRAQAEYRIFQNLGIYDLLGNVDLERLHTEQARTSQLQPGNIDRTRYNLGLAQLLPTGGTVSFGGEVVIVETDLEFDQPKSYSPSPVVRFVQPLLRNLGRLATDYQIRISRLNNDISRENFELLVATTIQQVENAYWTLVEAQEQLKVSEESLSLARELDEMNRVRVDVGTLAPLELVQSEAGIATREEEIIRARGALGDAMDDLRQLLDLSEGDLWSVALEPETDPETEARSIDLEQAIATALENRPELASQRLTVDLGRLDAAFQRNQRRPRLDLTATYGYNGGAPRFSDALEQVSNLDFPEWFLALNFAYPLQNRSARALVTIADLEVEKATARLDELELQVLTEVRTAARGVETAAQQIAAARASRRLAERNLEAERKRYENGMSTSFQILEIQEDLTAARSREVAAITAYRRALVEYYRAVGTLLEEKGVTLAGTDEEG
jgi:outer membrane protein TolC